MLKRLNGILRQALSGIGSLLFVLFILLMWSAQIRSCFTSNKPPSSSKMKIVKASLDNAKHRILCDKLSKIYASLNLTGDNIFEARFIDDKKSLNAASLGNGRFLLWETLADLPEWAVDSVLAHEVSHDLLLHSRKVEDFDDVRGFFTEVLSLFGGADKKTEKVLQDWSSNLILPKYSRSQEHEADKYAVKILSHCGYENPALTYSKTLSYIRDKYGDSGGGFFNYHPSMKERIEKILSVDHVE
jgi:Zn-dependent protease with chaperone function